jgi:hypothetical protein
MIAAAKPSVLWAGSKLKAEDEADQTRLASKPTSAILLLEEDMLCPYSEPLYRTLKEPSAELLVPKWYIDRGCERSTQFASPG